MVSLDGLLQYDPRDKEEGVVEASLVAEVMQEAMMQDYASRIYMDLARR